MRLVRAWSATAPPQLGKRSIICSEQPAVRRQNLHLGASGDQPFALVEHVTAVRGIRGHDGDPDESPPMQVEMTGLGRGHVVAPPELRHDRPDDGPLLLQRPAVTEQEVELQRPYERGFSLSSNVSMTSSTWMSL
jgi:hypothetical protein